MTDTKAVMQQALDALLGYKPHSLTHAKEQGSAIIALRAAIAQPAEPSVKPVAWVDVKDRHEGPYKFHGIEFLDSGRHNLYTSAQIAQPEQTAPRGTDAQILKEREITTSAIVGAMAYGFQNGEYPPDDSAWLRPFWTMGRRDAEREALIAQPEQQAHEVKNSPYEQIKKMCRLYLDDEQGRYRASAIFTQIFAAAVAAQPEQQTDLQQQNQQLRDQNTALDLRCAEYEKLAQPKAKYTTGHCEEKAGPKGCQLHNLQCGYPKCDRKAIAQPKDKP